MAVLPWGIKRNDANSNFLLEQLFKRIKNSTLHLCISIKVSSQLGEGWGPLSYPQGSLGGASMNAVSIGVCHSDWLLSKSAQALIKNYEKGKIFFCQYSCIWYYWYCLTSGSKTGTTFFTHNRYGEQSMSLYKRLHGSMEHKSKTLCTFTEVLAFLS